MATKKTSFLGSLFRRHADEVRSLAQRRVDAQDAEDMLQETYLRLLRQGNPETIRDPRAFLFTITDAFWRDLGAFQALPFPELAGARARYAIPPRRWFPAVALALTAVLIVIVVLAPPWSSNLIETYRTVKGERRTVPLPDGSRLALDTDTAVTVDFDRDLRRLDLLQGEIGVTVAHESARPFDVFAGAGHIRDLGTQFDAT